MKNNYELANLTEDQYNKIKSLENELGCVLIAWDDQSNSKKNYYDMYEDDRL